MGVQQSRHCFYSCVAAFSRSTFLLLPLSVCVLDQFPVWSSKDRFKAQAWHNKVQDRLITDANCIIRRMSCDVMDPQLASLGPAVEQTRNGGLNP